MNSRFAPDVMNDFRQTLLAALLDYHPIDDKDAALKNKIFRFVESTNQCFERTNLEGHITGSAWIVDKAKTHVLLTHHKKLNKWLQLGGHADGNPEVIAVALREAQEESGLKKIRLVSPNIFDIDIHLIPERADEPRHLHYDIRYIFEADLTEPLSVSDESNELMWVPLLSLEKFSLEESLLRMKRKMGAR